MNYYTLITITLCVHSILGFRLIKNYYIQCRDARVIPFGGSNTKFIIASVMGGVLTTAVFLLASLAVIKDWIKKRL